MPQEFCCYYSDVSKLHMICHSRLASTAHVGVIHQRLTSDWSTAIFLVEFVWSMPRYIHCASIWNQRYTTYIFYISIYLQTIIMGKHMTCISQQSTLQESHSLGNHICPTVGEPGPSRPRELRGAHSQISWKLLCAWCARYFETFTSY